MDEEELPLDSDSSDDDYKPTERGDVSEDDSGNDSVDEPCSDSEKPNDNKKRNKQNKNKTRKKLKSVKSEEDEEEEDEKENSEVVLTEEENKKKSDLLWADFMKDCGPTDKTKTEKFQVPKAEDDRDKPIEVKTMTVQSKTLVESPKVTEILTFAGEEIEVEKPVISATPGRKRRGGGGGVGGGLGSILSQMGKKGKLSTLEKSKLDWDKFKNTEGIGADLERHNKGRNGYLEKQDFLQRTDLRQFELEKSMRTTRRSLNR